MELLNDFSTSVRKAFSEIYPAWESLDGLVICGTHAPKDIEETLTKIMTYRLENRPILGICAGLQMLAIEFTRNEIGLRGAGSEEWYENDIFTVELKEFEKVVKKLPELRVGTRSVAWQIDGATLESHWHNYAVAGWVAVRMSERGYKTVLTDGVLEYAHRGIIVGVQFHPEYQSSKDAPHPLLVEFINICKTR